MKDYNISNTVKYTTKVAIITDIDTKNKTIDIQYISQPGTYKNLNFPYTTVGSTWGYVFTPVKGDKVLIDYDTNGIPLVKGMYPNNNDLLPYLDPGEVAMVSSNGSFLHVRNKRKRNSSNDEIVGYDDTTDSVGNDLDLEPGGVILRARSRQDQDTQTPSWYGHSYLALFDNGDVALQSMYQDNSVSLLHMDGTSGHVWLHAGNGAPQEYIELNPITKEIAMFSDGDTHLLSQQYYKKVTYSDDISIAGGVFEVSSGINPTNIGIASNGDAYFEQIQVNNSSMGITYSGLGSNTNPGLNSNPGDMIFNATSGQNANGGNINFNAAQGFNLYTYGAAGHGDIDLTSSQGFNLHTNGASGHGQILIQSENDSIILKVNNNTIKIINNNIYLDTAGSIYLSGATNSENNRIATIRDIITHVHPGVMIGSGATGTSTYTGTANGFIGTT